MFVGCTIYAVAYLAPVLRCFSTRNIGTIYYCHCPLVPAILGQSITVSTRNSKVLNTPLFMKYEFVHFAILVSINLFVMLCLSISIT